MVNIQQISWWVKYNIRNIFDETVVEGTMFERTLVERFAIEKTVIESSAVKEMVTVEKIGS